MSAHISIVIPVYNVAAFLPDALDSVATQSYQAWEAVIVNDGSRDDSADIQDAAVRQDARFKGLYHRNQGLSGARNRGMAYTNAPWLMFFDSDDWLYPLAVEGLVREAERLGLDLIDSYYTAVPEHWGPSAANALPRQVLLPAKREEFPALQARVAAFNRRLLFVAWGCLWRRSRIGDIRFDEGCLFEDVMFRFRVLPQIRSYALAEFATVAYRQREGSLIRACPKVHAWTRLADDLLEVRRLALGTFDFSPRELQQFRLALASRVKFYFLGALRRHTLSSEAREAMRQALLKLKAAGFPLYSKLPPFYRLPFWVFVRTGWWWRVLRTRK